MRDAKRGGSGGRPAAILCALVFSGTMARPVLTLATRLRGGRGGKPTASLLALVVNGTEISGNEMESFVGKAEVKEDVAPRSVMDMRVKSIVMVGVPAHSE